MPLRKLHGFAAFRLRFAASLDLPSATKSTRWPSKAERSVRSTSPLHSKHDVRR